jgi:hypothetical protein
MATLTKLLEEKKIIRVQLRLGRGKFDERKLYAYPECLEWMKAAVPKMVTGRVASDFTPAEQLIRRLTQWIVADLMAYNRMLKDMTPRSDEVWELKTPDLRIFGWMYRRREFIAVCGGYADDYKEPTKIRNYADDRRVVVTARNALCLNGEKFVSGEFNDLV